MATTKQNFLKGKVAPKPKAIKRSSVPSLASMERLRWRKRLAERLLMIAVMVFLGAIGVAAYMTDGKIFASTVTALRTLEGSEGRTSVDASVNCRHPKNKNTPYCQERTAEIDGKWNSMSRVQGGKSSPFKLSGPPAKK